jgi:uncharacterized protein YprB with RNaseH-like and TPR domain
MKTFHNEEIYIKTDNFSDSIFKESTMFFDIETTGFSPVKAIVYMIGCARRIKNRIVIDQYFAESPNDEAAVIEEVCQVAALSFPSMASVLIYHF